jgi:GNAT superfamily N-acetyltransferase
MTGAPAAGGTKAGHPGDHSPRRYPETMPDCDGARAGRPRHESRAGTAGPMAAIALRPATPADSEFCYRLHRAAMGEYITAIWGWDEERQRGFHNRGFAPGRWQIISAGGTDVGMIHVEYRPTETVLSRIEIHPDHQGQGIGAYLISVLIEEARHKGQDLVLEVLAVNRRAQALYQRLGLTEVARHGDNNIKIVMRTVPPRPPP